MNRPTGTKRVLDVGNCGPDHVALIEVLEANFDVEVVQAHGMVDALTQLRSSSFDLVTVNRLMDRDGSPGLDIIRKMKSAPALMATPVLMVTNFAQHQETAQRAGAVPGFGKDALRDPKTIEELRHYLG